ncbi:MAG: hypothetical protein M3512_09505 [Bacteroidota bacterium]|nr:hypothetical protein [Bacteroidota bacterium]
MKYCFFIALILFTSFAHGQDEKHFVQVGVTANAYKGDLQKSYENWGSSFHLGLRFNKKKRLNGSFLISIGSVTGQNLNPIFQNIENSTIQPNRFFRSSILTGQYDLQVNIIKTEQFAVFLSQGVGLMRHNPKDDQGNNLLDQNSTRAPNEDFNNISIMFPTQAGASLKLKNDFGFGIQTGFLNTLTDYIDNISMLGSNNGNDNILFVRLSFLAPISLTKK